MGMRSSNNELAGCKELREAKEVHCFNKGLSSAELATLGTLGSVLPSLEELHLTEPTAGPDGVQQCSLPRASATGSATGTVVGPPWA